MDANGLKFCLLAAAHDWQPQSDAVYFDAASGTLRLSRHRSDPDWAEAEAAATARLDQVPQSIDAFGTRAFWSPLDANVMATGAVPGNAHLFAPPPGDIPTDVALGFDDLVYVALGGRITIVDPRGRFLPTTVPPLAGFEVWRLAPDPRGGVWALDRVNQKLARLRGTPSTVRPHPPYDPNTVRPCVENPDPPRLIALGHATWPADEHAVAIAASAEGRLAVMLWKSGDFAHLRLLDDNGTLDSARLTKGARTPFSLAFVSAKQIALLLPDVKEAPVYSLDDPGPLIPPDGAIYPLRDHDGGPFIHGVTLPPRYPTLSGSLGLYQLSLPWYERAGSAINAAQLDSGGAGAVWHRLYLEARIPDHCGTVVQLGAVDDPAHEPIEWYPHRFGAIFTSDGQIPRGAWLPVASEVPFHPGLLHCPPQQDRSGLFTALIQRSGKRVRNLRGRYLKVRIELQGNGLTTPEVAGLRAYSSRFSYANKYLSELYRENVFGAEADEPGGCTPADFLERFIDNFEGVLTPLEDRIADSYLLTDPTVAPADALEWLGSWIGVAFDGAYRESQRRELLAAAPELYRRRGTARGLGMALDIATDGAVSRGQIVILEDYRMRRTFATILGADLSAADDPLLAGLSSSANSYVGDTLFLGDENRNEFLAIFAATLHKSNSESAAVEAFFDGLAHRVTILVHQEIDPQDLSLVRRIAALETPAHVAVRVERASNAFRAGVASLVGLDTYLAPKPKPRTARIDVSYIGRGDFIDRAPALDPRLGGEDIANRGPQADLAAPPFVEFGQSFGLTAGASRAFDGHKIVKYIWTRLD